MPVPVPVGTTAHPGAPTDQVEAPPGAEQDGVLHAADGEGRSLIGLDVADRQGEPVAERQGAQGHLGTDGESGGPGVVVARGSMLGAHLERDHAVADPQAAVHAPGPLELVAGLGPGSPAPVGAVREVPELEAQPDAEDAPVVGREGLHHRRPQLQARSGSRRLGLGVLGRGRSGEGEEQSGEEDGEAHGSKCWGTRAERPGREDPRSEVRRPP